MFSLTMFILLMSMITLVKGNIFYGTTVAVSQDAIDQLDGKEPNGPVILQGFLTVIFALFMIYQQMSMIYYATAIDILQYPTWIMLGIFLVNFVWSLVTIKPTPSTDEQKRAKYVMDIANAKRRTFRGTVSSLLWTVYSLYILWIVVGGAV